MSIKGVEGGGVGLQSWSGLLRAGDAKSAGVRDRGAVHETPQPAKTAIPERALSAQAPEGVDPMLWNVLTTEERVFFSKFRSLGPLTYAPAAAPRADALPRGGRIDVTV